MPDSDLPDLLSDGLDAAALDPERPTRARVGDDDVVVVRDPDEGVCVLAATCTHYGGPLGDGLCLDGRLRCPWHHAAFDLRTGEPVGAPALDPITVFDVAERDGRVYATGPREAPTDRSAPRAAPERIVVVGSGAAGAAAVEEVRRQGHAGPVTLVGDEPPVDRPNLSKDYLAGDAPEEWLPLRGADFYDEIDVDLRSGTRVTAIDRERHVVHLDDGDELPYDALLLATGAEPRRLPVDGADATHVHLLRTRADAEAIIEAAERATTAVLVGAGFIGLEVAASLGARDVDVTVVAPEDIPLAPVLGDELGRFVQGLHADHGTGFRLGRSVDHIGETAVRLDDGTELPADLVVVGIGVTPRDDLAAAADLATDDGILVDAGLATGDPGIWAAGDVARLPDGHGGTMRVEHWVAAQRQGQAAARSMLGATTEPDVPFFWSRHHDAIIAMVGHAPDWDDVQIDGDPAERDVTAVYRTDGAVRAVATIFRDEVSLRAERALARADTEALEALLG